MNFDMNFDIHIYLGSIFAKQIVSHKYVNQLSG